MRNLLRAMFIAISTVFLLAAADLSGTYSGKLSIETSQGERSRAMTLIVKQAADQVTVTIGPSESEQHPASNVKAEGEKLSFELVPPGAPRAALVCDLKLSEGKLIGTAIVRPREDPEMTAKVEFKKQ